MNNRFQLLILSTLFFVSVSSLADNNTDLILINGKVWTGDANLPNAAAIAISSNKIIAVGDSEEISKLANSTTRVIDLKGKRVTPGFIDNHTHFSEVSGLLNAVQLRDATSRAEFVKRIEEFAKTMVKGNWMLMGVWDHEAWGASYRKQSGLIM